MSLLQLESFVAVAEEAHVGRAARRLNVSQPPLSRRIHALEEELGVTLFERTSRGMTLRPEGVALLPRAREILDQVERVRRFAFELSGQAADPPRPGPDPARR